MDQDAGPPLPVFMNKVLIETVTLMHLHIVCCCFCTPKAEVNNVDRDSMTYKAENGYYIAFTEKVCQPLHIDGNSAPLIMLL